MKNHGFTSLVLALAITFVSTCCLAGDDDKNLASFPENKGNLRYSITVSKFENKAGWRGGWSLEDGMVDIMTNALYESGWFLVLGDTEMRNEAMDEQDFNTSGRTAKGKKSAETGRMTPAQLLVSGAVTHVQDESGGGSGGIKVKGMRFGGSKETAEINMTISLIDSETGQVSASTKVVGKAGKNGIRIGYSGTKLGGVTGGGEVHNNDNVGLACEDAVAKAVLFLIEQLEGISWEGTIAYAKGDRIILNRGSREGVQVGARFEVGETEEIIDEDTGEVLDTLMTTIATLEVTSVKEKTAYCKALSGGGLVQKGMTVFPLP